MKIRQSNAFAAITVLVLVAMLFIGMWSIMPSFAKIYTMFTDDTQYVNYTNEGNCSASRGEWYSGSCHQLQARPTEVMGRIRRIWLVAPFIFVAGLVMWFFTVALRKDPYYFNDRPPGGGFQ